MIFGLDLKWKKDIGIADLINVFLALLTLIAVYFSKVAAESSKDSVLLTKQTVEYTHNPKLIPLNKRISKTASKINHDIGSNLPLDHATSNFNSELEIANVFEGNAYMVSAWLSIDDEQFEKYNGLITPENYAEKFSEEYSISIEYNKEKKPLSLHLHYGPSGNMVLESYYIYKGAHDVAILKPDETLKITVPSYIAIILTHLSYSSSIIDQLEWNNRAVGLKLNVKYKTKNNLESDLYLMRTYSVTVPFTRYDKSTSSLEFYIQYTFIDEYPYNENIK